MFVEREGWVPSKQSLDLVETYAPQLIPQFRNRQVFEAYYRDHKYRIGFDIDYADRYLPKDGKILEIGALPYFLTLPLREKGFRVAVLDKPSGEYSPEITARYEMDVRLGDLDAEPIPAGDGEYDAVIMNEVFEHLRMNLIFSMREVNRVLRPGGRLLLSTPNLRSIRGLYNLLLKQEAYAVMGGLYHNYSSLETDQVMGHVREYTAKEVADFLSALGFTVEGVIYRGSYSGSLFWRMSHYATRVWPQLKPSFSLVARKA